MHRVLPIVPSKYSPPFYFRQTDIVTIFSSKLRKVPKIHQQRERLELSDRDFLDLDWSYTQKNNPSCILLLHGLEGSSKARYILGTTAYFNSKNIDVCAVNYRNCSGVPNRKFACYHSGKTDDIREVIEHLIHVKGYKKLIIKGYSLGANMALKLVGESTDIPKQIKAVIAISAPVDLASSSNAIMRPRNFVYAKNFMRQLMIKLKAKQRQFPDLISPKTMKSIRTIKDFDDAYTSVSHGFANADDYYAQCSSLPLLKHIKVPTLILNAKNDSFLGDTCYPYEAAEANEQLFLETPDYGGHVAFYQPSGVYYNDERAYAFAKPFLD